MPAERSCYVHIQLPGTFEMVSCASLRVVEVASGVYEGSFLYGKRYLQRRNVVALDPFHLPLRERPFKFTKLKGIPGAVRDASPDTWGRRVIQAKPQRSETDIHEMDYLLYGPDDGAGNLRFGEDVTPTDRPRPFNRTHQLSALAEAAARLEVDGRLPYELLASLEPGTSMGGARPKATIEDANKLWLAKLPAPGDRHDFQRIEYATLELARAAGLAVCRTRMETLAAREALLLERFDREWVADKQAYPTTMTIRATTPCCAPPMDGAYRRPTTSSPCRWRRRSRATSRSTSASSDAPARATTCCRNATCSA